MAPANCGRYVTGEYRFEILHGVLHWVRRMPRCRAAIAARLVRRPPGLTCRAYLRRDLYPPVSQRDSTNSMPSPAQYLYWAGRLDETQLPDGTLVSTSPSGRTYTTQPPGALFFPQLADPTGEAGSSGTRPPHAPDRGLAMPTRKRTRAQDRAHRVQWERGLNRARYAADPPPF